ncbi:hypothetical protein [Ferruginibacter sp.]
MIKKLIIPVIAICLTACASKKQNYTVDSAAAQTIDSIFKANNAMKDTDMTRFNFYLENTFDAEQFDNNGLDLAYILKGNISDSIKEYSSAMTKCYLSKDTIVLVGGLFYESGFFVRLTIHNDQCNAQLLLTGSEKIYSLTSRHEDLQKEVMINSDSLSITFTQEPVYKNGSTLKGKMHIKFQPVYELGKEHTLLKIQPQFGVVFDAKVEQLEEE